VHLLATDLTWPDHPLGRDQAGTKESVSGITRAMVQEYLARHYQPASAVLAVAGNIEHDRAVQEAAEQLKAWQQKRSHSYLPMSMEQEGARLRIEHRSTQQAHLALTLPSLSRFDDDKYNLSLLNTILGQGMSSRLFLEVREKRGLAYSVYSYVSPQLDTGLMGVYAGVDADQIERALRAILEELEKMKQEPVSGEELDKAKEFTKGRLQLQMEDSFSVASWAGRQEILEDRVLSVDEVLQNVDAVTTADIQRVAQRLLKQEKLNLAVVGPYDANQEEHFRSLLSL
jgi:predicted Zn-dependent peptidase